MRPMSPTTALRDVGSPRPCRSGARQLRAALDGGALDLAFQPIVTLDTGAVRGFEALLRWEGASELGWSLERVIEVAEETGMIVPLGRWVVARACAQVAAWRSRLGVAIPVHVNMAASQLDDAMLPGFVASELDRHHLSPDVLVAELTELDLARGPSTRRRVHHQLSELGIRSALDDFGTVSASLLHSSPYDIVKVDRSFIAGVGSDRRTMGILLTLVHLARRLGLEVIVEGVETDQQRLVLLDVGCRLAQGFLFAPPLSSVSAQALLAARIPLSA